MAVDRQHFTVASVKKSRRAGDKSLYVDDVPSVEVWVVRLTSNSFIGRAMTFEMESEVEAQRFSEGAVISFNDAGELFFQ